MYLGVTPLLTRGPFAMMYGGEAIFDQLSPLPPARGVHVLCFVSIIFQIFLYSIKKVKSKEEGVGYLKQLKKNLVDNVVNVYSLVIVICIFVGTIAYSLHHMWTVGRNRAVAVTSLVPSLLPANIGWALTLMAFATLLSFFTQHALR